MPLEENHRAIVSTYSKCNRLRDSVRIVPCVFLPREKGGGRPWGVCENNGHHSLIFLKAINCFQLIAYSFVALNDAKVSAAAIGISLCAYCLQLLDRCLYCSGTKTSV